MNTIQSPRRVLQVASDAACQALPAHRHRFSLKKFTQPQLLASPVLKEFLRTDYLGRAGHLADHPDLAWLLDLKTIPHFTTFQKAAARLLRAVPGRGPGSDLRQFKAAVKEVAGRARIGMLLADADYDAEWVHEHVRTYGIRTIIPHERGAPTDKPPVGRWRRRMKQRFDKVKHGQRWQTDAGSEGHSSRSGRGGNRQSAGAGSGFRSGAGANSAIASERPSSVV